MTHSSIYSVSAPHSSPLPLNLRLVSGFYPHVIIGMLKATRWRHYVTQCVASLQIARRFHNSSSIMLTLHITESILGDNVHNRS